MPDEFVSKEIEGKEFRVRLLPFGEARKLRHIANRMHMYFGEDAPAKNTPATLQAELGGVLTDKDLDDLSAAFAAKTTVHEGESMWSLRTSMDQIFPPDGVAFHEWLSFCLEENFGAVMGKAREGTKEMTEYLKRKKVELEALSNPPT